MTAIATDHYLVGRGKGPLAAAPLNGQGQHEAMTIPEISEPTEGVEHRTRTPYWRKGLERRSCRFIRFGNGHATNAPETGVEYLG